MISAYAADVSAGPAYQPSYMVTSLYGQTASASWLHPHLAHINHFLPSVNTFTILL